MASRLQDVILRGLAAARPAANTVANGTLYFSTDTATTAQSDGVTWNTYTDGGSGGAPSNAQFVTLAVDGSLTDERVLTAGVNISLVDNGAGNTVVTSFEAGLTDEGNSSTAQTINFTSRYRWTHKSTLTGNVTYTLSNPVTGGVYTILIYTGAGGFSVTWPGTVLWPASTTPIITVAASKIDLVVLTWNGTNYLAAINQNY